ncbi:substrate-binding domain-containing protein [Lutibaculum baratangense]|uniref:Periplasmic molybdate-binding protein n=1 Tax=Lutibaculum baratangense AMV1 TaxID=631454 RepID=V4RR22_9HYPH|nr:substrate-binding domain-containing protein [Lutibaculum baratangense]ESR25600.1 Periplasmic molybdate-binding protein [Lutibaculum baratangense AMV1]
MMRVTIEPAWRFTRDGEAHSMLVMLDFLNEIRETGKITRAAESAQLSYRHCWNLIERWSAYFNAPLVERRRGRGTVLTPLGEKLVWAGQRLQARLGPQLQNLARELETEINQILPDGSTTIRMHASHGFAVQKLQEVLARRGGVNVDLRYISNQTSLVSLANGSCDLAGMHLPQGPLRARSIEDAKPWLNASEHRVISFVTREMGLMVRQGNPLRITSLDRLADPAVRFVNRDPESGTRLLLEQLIELHGLDREAINGYERAEFTHAAVAAYVASGMADVCFGFEAAARQFGLDFVPLLTEDYFFVCRKEALGTDALRQVLDVMRSEEFGTAISAMPGYAVEDPGEIKTLAQMFAPHGE